jgi:hypothetical protein
MFMHQAAPKLGNEGIGSVFGSLVGQLHGILGQDPVPLFIARNGRHRQEISVSMILKDGPQGIVDEVHRKRLCTWHTWHVSHFNSKINYLRTFFVFCTIL